MGGVRHSRTRRVHGTYIWCDEFADCRDQYCFRVRWEGLREWWGMGRQTRMEGAGGGEGGGGLRGSRGGGVARARTASRGETRVKGPPARRAFSSLGRSAPESDLQDLVADLVRGRLGVAGQPCPPHSPVVLYIFFFFFFFFFFWGGGGAASL